ncbi:MAG: carbohydrate kinase [Oscillospiraceae bacterium]|nr:carbohydrate kinase [Oscillospiraceae bacterium]
MKRFDAVCLGELLVDFTPFGRSPAGMRLFEQNAGGGPANVAAALAAFGLRSAFVGKVGGDTHGAFLRSAIESMGADASGLIADPSVNTTLAFVTLDEGGERGFSFISGAHLMLKAEELDMSHITNARVFNFSSLTMTAEPALGATVSAAKQAREAGCIIAFDPNYRAPLWPGETRAAERIRSALPLCDIVKISEEEAVLLTGAANLNDAGQAVLDAGPLCVLITRGAEGASVYLPSGCARTPAMPAQVVDTTGAGDAFMAGFLYGLLTRGLHPRGMTPGDAREISVFAHAAAALCVSRRGGMPAMPRLDEVTALINKLT